MLLQMALQTLQILLMNDANVLPTLPLPCHCLTNDANICLTNVANASECLTNATNGL